MALLVACTSAPNPPPSGSTQTKTIVDSQGRSVLVPANPQRVVSLNSDLSELIVALGASKQLISAGFRISRHQAWISDQLPNLSKLPSPQSESGLNVEDLASLKPDLIVTSVFGEIGYKDVLDSAGRLGAPIVVIALESLAGYTTDVMLLARTLGVERRGRELTAILQQEIQRVQQRASGIAPSARVTVYHGLADVYRTIGSGIFEDDQIKLAGGMNVAASQTGFGIQVTPEQLLAWNPQAIVVLWEAADTHFTSDPKLSQLSAVKTGRVYIHPEQGWGFATPRAIFAITWLAKKLHPEKWSDFDLMASANSFYRQVYGFPYPERSLEVAIR